MSTAVLGVPQASGDRRTNETALPPFDGFYRGRRVFVTGHTGFKGSWLVAWLHALGADVTGYALDPPSSPNLHDLLHHAVPLSQHRGDITDHDALVAAIADAGAEIVFHLAAQSLVHRSTDDPLGTFRSNTLGTATVLEAVRQSESVRAVVLVTSDKCYLNEEWPFAYRETDRLGGHDAYSASKAAAEVVSAPYLDDRFRTALVPPFVAEVATARAGNVIGGGDWSPRRLVPDVTERLRRGEPVVLRSPDARRPWQHVLEPLSGYLHLGARLAGIDGHRYRSAWNFGPGSRAELRVIDLVRSYASMWRDDAADLVVVEPMPGIAEAQLLNLDAGKAERILGWRPVWGVADGLRETATWYQAYDAGLDVADVTMSQIHAYMSDAVDADVAWARPHVRQAG